MTRKQTMRLLTMLLVCIIILNFIAQPKSEAIGGSLALALGGTSAAKAFLAFIMSCVAMGVTYVTIDEAIAAYDHYTENASVSIEDLRYVQQETWTGNYEAVANDLSDIYSGIKSWLEGLFGTLQVGENIKTSQIIYNFITSPLDIDIQYGNSFYVQQSIGSIYYKNFTTVEQSNPSYYKLHIEKEDGTTREITYAFSKSSLYYIRFYNNNNSMQIFKNGIYETSISNVLSLTDKLYTDIEDIGSISAIITTDAPILNPSYTPQNRTFPPAPYLPYINPGNEKVSQSISAAGGTMEVYNGTYDQYLDDIVENATWEDIQGVISGSVPTTTLTETAEGLIIGEATAGIPYPNPDTTAPGEVLTGLGGIMGLLQGITNWIAQLWQLISGIFAIPEGLSLDFSSLRLVNFKDKFPFSIPWDIYRAVAVFAKSPETPDFSIDIETDYLNIDHSINLAPIDLPLRFARYVMTIFFIFFLASKTRDLIKW